MGDPKKRKRKLMKKNIFTCCPHIGQSKNAIQVLDCFHLNLEVATGCKFLKIDHGSQRGKYGGLCVGDNISCVHTI